MTRAEHATSHDRARRRRIIALCIVIGGCVIALAIVSSFLLAPGKKPTERFAQGTPSPPSSVPHPVPSLSTRELAALPEAKYDAVIGGLLPFAGDASVIEGVYQLSRAVPVFGADQRTPVARLEPKDFVGAATTIVVAGRQGAWSLVLTPARVALPSASGGNAPAQSAGWVATVELHRVAPLDTQIVISVSKQTLEVQQNGAATASFGVGVGAPDTPTPTGVTGYLQQRYLDPRQGESVYPIQLTSLHASAQDEPFGGNDGGLIGIHYNEVNSGAVSHGCVRLTEEAIQAVNALPLGTPITIVE